MASTTPTGVQSTRTLLLRRLLVAGLNLATYAGLAAALVHVLGAGGWTLVDILMLACFLVATPWSVLGFWNAVIGLIVLHAARDPMAQVAPCAAAGDDPVPLRIRCLAWARLDAQHAMALADGRVVLETASMAAEPGEAAVVLPQLAIPRSIRAPDGRPAMLLFAPERGKARLTRVTLAPLPRWEAACRNKRHRFTRGVKPGAGGTDSRASTVLGPCRHRLSRTRDAP
jgi:hypothetical protein